MKIQFLDNLGRLFKKTSRPSEKDLGTIQPHERTDYSPSYNLTPDKLARILRDADNGDVLAQAALFEEMEEKDGHLNGELVKRKNAVARELDWEVLPVSNAAADVTHAKFIEQTLKAIPELDQAFFDMLDAIGKGYSGVDIGWVWDGSYHIPAKLTYMHPTKLTFINTVAYPQWFDEYGIASEIPAYRIVYHRHKAKSGHDTRAGVVRVCAWMYLFKRYAIKDWAAFCDIYGIPFRLGRYAPGEGEQHEKEKKDLLNAVRAIGSDGAGIISKNAEIEFIQASSHAGKDNIYQVFAEFCNKEMSKAVIGNALSTENYSVGARASSETGNNVRKDLVKGDAWGLSDTINNQIIRPLMGYNFGWDVPRPVFRFNLDESEDLLSISQCYKNLVEMGQPISIEHISKRFGVPIPGKDERLLGGLT